VSDQNEFVETIFQKLPNLKLGVPFDQIQFSDPHRDVGIQKLPVMW